MTAHASPAIAENPWLAQSVQVAGITHEVPGVATYHFRFRDPAHHARYRFAPGQFNMIYIPGAGEMAISLSGGAGTDGTWDHTIRLAGNVTRSLAALGVGADVGLRGPYGTSWPLDQCVGADVVVVAGGIGLPPLRPAIHALLTHRAGFGRCALLYGARTPDTLLYTNQYHDWIAGGMEIQTTVDRAQPGWTGNVGVVPLLLDRLQPFSPTNTVLLLCGPEVMMRYTVISALERGMRKEHIWVSMERNMQCAVGLCGHCQLGPAFVCKDGPIFRYDKIEPFIDVEAL